MPYLINIGVNGALTGTDRCPALMRRARAAVRRQPNWRERNRNKPIIVMIVKIRARHSLPRAQMAPCRACTPFNFRFKEFQGPPRHQKQNTRLGANLRDL